MSSNIQASPLDTFVFSAIVVAVSPRRNGVGLTSKRAKGFHIRTLACLTTYCRVAFFSSHSGVQHDRFLSRAIITSTVVILPLKETLLLLLTKALPRKYKIRLTYNLFSTFEALHHWEAFSILNLLLFFCFCFLINVQSRKIF